MFFVYILQSLISDKCYVGYTAKDPKERLQEHNGGADQYTRLNGPWKLKYYESFVCEACARKREMFLKSGVGEKIVKIIKDNF